MASDHPSKTAWEAENVIQVKLKVNRNQDPELFNLLQQADNKAGLIRELLKKALDPTAHTGGTFMKKTNSIPAAAASGSMMVYVATRTQEHGDWFDLVHTFDLEVARKAVRADIDHLTKAERSRVNYTVDGWIIPVEAGETAKEAFLRWSSDQCDMPNQDFCEVIEN